MEDEQFASKDEEIQSLRKRLQECQIELEEYQESSRELEAELETQLTASEKRNVELKNQNLRLQTENENLKSKLANLTGQTSNQIMELQRQLNETQINNAKLTRCIRELEQSNDDLERAKRALHASLDDFEKKLNYQIEKNVLLENELGEKEQLEEIIQRLKDEARDLKQELLVQQQTPSTNHLNDNFKKTAEVVQEEPIIVNHSDKKPTEQIKQCNLNTIRPNTLYSAHSFSSNTCNPTSCNNESTVISKKMQENSNSNDLPNSLLSPSTRISLLNIVSDLLRKVGSLESRLNQTSTSCKTTLTNSTSTTNANSSIKANGLNCQTNGHFN